MWCFEAFYSILAYPDHSSLFFIREFLNLSVHQFSYFVNILQHPSSKCAIVLCFVGLVCQIVSF